MRNTTPGKLLIFVIVFLVLTAIMFLFFSLGGYRAPL